MMLMGPVCSLGVVAAGVWMFRSECRRHRKELQAMMETRSESLALEAELAARRRERRERPRLSVR